MKHYISENKDAYDAIADQFSSTRDYVWNDVKPLAQYIKPGSAVLDVGCGNGRVYQMCENVQGVTYTGVDQSEKLIAIAKEKFPEASFLSGPMTKLPVADASIDVVLCIAAFHHLPDTHTRIVALEEMKRVLAQDGRIIILNWNLKNDWVRERISSGKYTLDEFDDHVIIPWMNAKRDILSARHYWHISLAEMQTLAQKVGLQIEQNGYVRQGEESDEKQGDNMLTIIKPA